MHTVRQAENSLPNEEVADLNLQAFDIFKGLSLVECADVAKKMKCRAYEAGSFVISAAQCHRDVYFIVSGKVRSCAISASGKQVYYEDLCSGMMFGEFSAIDHKERSADCMAVAESVVAAVSDIEFMQLMDTYPSIKDAVLLRLVHIIRQQMKRVSESVFYSVSQRVRFELMRISAGATSNGKSLEIDVVPTHQEIAFRIGTHREAVSREIAHLKDQGLISWGRAKLVVHDVDALLKLVEH